MLAFYPADRLNEIEPPWGVPIDSCSSQFAPISCPASGSNWTSTPMGAPCDAKTTTPAHVTPLCGEALPGECTGNRDLGAGWASGGHIVVGGRQDRMARGESKRRRRDGAAGRNKRGTGVTGVTGAVSRPTVGMQRIAKPSSVISCQRFGQNQGTCQMHAARSCRKPVWSISADSPSSAVGLLTTLCDIVEVMSQCPEGEQREA